MESRPEAPAENSPLVRVRPAGFTRALPICHRGLASSPEAMPRASVASRARTHAHPLRRRRRGDGACDPLSRRARTPVRARAQDRDHGVRPRRRFLAPPFRRARLGAPHPRHAHRLSRQPRATRLHALDEPRAGRPLPATPACCVLRAARRISRRAGDQRLRFMDVSVRASPAPADPEHRQHAAHQSLRARPRRDRRAARRVRADARVRQGQAPVLQALLHHELFRAADPQAAHDARSTDLAPRDPVEHGQTR
jgi:hypothetical protein